MAAPALPHPLSTASWVAGGDSSRLFAGGAWVVGISFSMPSGATGLLENGFVAVVGKTLQLLIPSVRILFVTKLITNKNVLVVINFF